MVKMMRSKIFILFLIVALVGILLAACSSNNSNDNTPSNTKDSTSSNTKTSDKKNNEDKPAKQEPLEINMVLALFEEAPDMNNEFWIEYQKRTNTKLNIEWVPYGDYGTKLDLILASGDLPDVLFAPTPNAPNILSAIKNGAFWDVGEVLGDFSEYPNLETNSSPLAYRYLTDENGSIWGVPRNRPNVDQGLFLRKDWLDILGMNVPKTMEEYADYLAAVANEDPDGNGIADTMGYVHAYGGTGIPGNIAAAFGAMEPHYDSDGGLVYRDLTPAHTKTVEWMRDLYARGGLPQEFATIKNTQAQELFEAGKAGSYQRNIWRAWMFQESIRKINPEAEVIVFAPEGPDGHFGVSNSSGIFGAHYLSKKLSKEKVEQILDFFESTNTEEFFEFVFFGMEGVHHDVVDGNKVMTEKGSTQIGTSVQQPQPLTWNNWWKAFDKNAPKEYNDETWNQVESWFEKGYFDPFGYVVSDTWTENWPRYQNEFTTKAVEAIVGQISMEEYKEYVDSLNNKPEFKKAYQEFKDYYDTFWK